MNKKVPPRPCFGAAGKPSSQQVLPHLVSQLSPLALGAWKTKRPSPPSLRAPRAGIQARGAGPRTEGELSAATEQERAPRPRAPAAPHINTRAPETRANARPRALPGARKHTPSPTSPSVSHLLCARSPKHTPSCKHGLAPAIAPETQLGSPRSPDHPKALPTRSHSTRVSHAALKTYLLLRPHSPTRSKTRPHNTRSPRTLQVSLAP